MWLAFPSSSSNRFVFGGQSERLAAQTLGFTVQGLIRRNFHAARRERDRRFVERGISGKVRQTRQTSVGDARVQRTFHARVVQVSDRARSAVGRAVVTSALWHWGGPLLLQGHFVCDFSCMDGVVRPGWKLPPCIHSIYPPLTSPFYEWGTWSVSGRVTEQSMDGCFTYTRCSNQHG